MTNAFVKARIEGSLVNVVRSPGASLRILALVVACQSCGDPSTTDLVTRVEFDAEDRGLTTAERVDFVASATGWIITTNPRVALGIDEGNPNQEFVRPVDATRLSNGDLVVADVGHGAMRWYDQDGVHLEDVGGAGEGPGEFRWMSWIDSWGGDSVMIYDPALRRLSVFGPDRTLARSIAPNELAALNELGPWQVLGDGTAIAMKWGTPIKRTATGFEERERDLYAIDLRNGAVEPLGLRWRAVFYWTTFQPPQAPYLDFPVPFAPATEFGAGHGLLVIGETSPLRLSAYEAGSARIWELSMDKANRSPSAIERLQVHKSLEERSANPAIRRAIGQALGGLEASYPLPHFGRRSWERLRSSTPDTRSILIDPDRNVWVLSYSATHQESRSWMLFSSEGHWIGTVLMPHRFEPLEIGRDYVLGWQEQLDGRIAILEYELQRPDTPNSSSRQ